METPTKERHNYVIVRRCSLTKAYYRETRWPYRDEPEAVWTAHLQDAVIYGNLDRAIADRDELRKLFPISGEFNFPMGVYEIHPHSLDLISREVF